MEQGRIVRISSGQTWVESINRSACGQCAAKSVCGQSALAKWAEASNLLAIDDVNPDWQVGDHVSFYVPGDALARAALLVYMMPLACMLLLSTLAYHLWSHDGVALAGAGIGLWVGMKLVQKFTVKSDKGLQMGLTLGDKLIHP